MTPLAELQLFIVVAMMSHLDADVRIVQTRINAGNNCTECGEKLVLTCYIDNYFPNSTMTWQNENSSLTLVSCAGSTCTLNPAVGSEYSKSEDTTTGTFNLIVPTVTRDNNGISYLCENGLFAESSIVKVRDYRPILNETIGTTLKARTGCINESVKVMFSWRKLKAGSGAESYDDAEYIGTNATVDTDFCTQDTECGLNGFITLERTIEVKPGVASDYHLIAVISYDGFEMESVQTNKTYKIDVSCVFGIGDGVVIVLFLILFIAHLVLAIRIIHKICIDLKCTCKDAIISNSAAFAFLCMSIIVYCVCKYTDKLCIFCENIDLFGIICGCLLGASFVIGIGLYCSTDKSEDRNYNPCFFFTFLNLIIFFGFAVSDFCKKNKVSDFCRKKGGLPHQPKDLKVAENGTTDTSIKVQWTEGFDGGCKQNFYVYVNGNEQKVDSTCKRGNIWSYMCKDLTPGSWYNIEIKAKNRKGWSASCHAKYRTTGKPDPPTKFRIADNGITDTSITVEWRAGYDGGYEQTFYVYYNGKEHEVKSSIINENVYSYKCGGLKPRSTYDIELKAKNIKGTTESSILKKCTTKDYPDPPKDLTVPENCITDTSITVQWTEGFDGGCKQKQYFYVNGNEQKVDSTCKRGNIWSYTCKDLTPGSWYNIEIKAKNIIGWSASCHAKCRTTGRPDPPKDFELAVDGVKDETMTVEWKEGFNGGYEQTFYVKVNNEKEKPVGSECKLKSIWSYTCKGLKPGTDYIIEIKAKNCKGFSEPCHLKDRTSNISILANTQDEGLAGEE